MKAISLVPGTTNVSLEEVPEPQITAPDEIKVAEGGRADAPPGEEKLVLGHEMFGAVVEIGEEVSLVQKGDYGVFSVRRGCGKCPACNSNLFVTCLLSQRLIATAWVSSDSDSRQTITRPPKVSAK